MCVFPEVLSPVPMYLNVNPEAVNVALPVFVVLVRTIE